MKNKILFIFSLISFVVVVFYTMELMEAVTNFANKHGDLIRIAGMVFNMALLLFVLINGILVMFYFYEKTCNKKEKRNVTQL
jgi:hypothetical protein